MFCHHQVWWIYQMSKACAKVCNEWNGVDQYILIEVITLSFSWFVANEKEIKGKYRCYKL